MLVDIAMPISYQCRKLGVYFGHIRRHYENHKWLQSWITEK